MNQPQLFVRKDKLRMVKLTDITVGDRFRTDMGNIEELAVAGSLLPHLWDLRKFLP